MKCKAKSKRSQKQCKNNALKGKQVCRMHGGKSLAGIASPRLKTGEYSRYLTTLDGKLRDRFLEAQKNPDILSLSPDIYMLDARIEDVMSRVLQGESGERWRVALTAFDEFASAQADKNREGALAALTKLSNLLRSGVADYTAWDEVKDLWKHRTRLVESERKRLIESRQMMAVDVMLVLASALAAAVKRHVTNADTLAAIQRDVDRSTAGQGPFTGIIDTALVQRG